SLSRGSLPDALRAAVDAATPGDVLPPLFIEPENLWCVFRLDRVLPATLDHPEVLETLRNELFDQWIMKQLDGLDIEVLVGE
ncbi:MAG: peptidylprolyl isomerase, partial [Cyanobacteriota bacterium]